jgi:ribosomal RNA-processing protein 9
MNDVGSCDGSVRIWRSGKKILQVFSIPVQGFVNCLEFSQDGDYLVVAIGQEHRLGRWWKLKEVKNQVIIIPLQKIDK